MAGFLRPRFRFRRRCRIGIRYSRGDLALHRLIACCGIDRFGRCFACFSTFACVFKFRLRRSQLWIGVGSLWLNGGTLQEASRPDLSIGRSNAACQNQKREKNWFHFHFAGVEVFSTGGGTVVAGVAASLTTDEPAADLSSPAFGSDLVAAGFSMLAS